MATSLPSKIDRFTILRVLGKGSQGIVYLAQDPQLKRRVAIKAVNLSSDLQIDNDIDQLLAEARTVSKLQHANIVSIFDVAMQARTPYLVLEFIDGESLASRIRRGASMDEKIRIMRDILNGAAAAHAQGIVHCDIKPANILIGAQGQAKIADFGLAYLTEVAGEKQDALYGTPQYMAPEYIETRQHQKVSDVFSIGLVCYELLTGKPAFSGDEVYQVLHAIMNSELVAPSRINGDIDERLEALIARALVRDPAQRFADAGEMLQALNDYIALGDASEAGESSDATVGFLLRRMRHKKDFPAFSHTISVLNEASASETESLARVSNAILKDYALTNKVLRLVNSAYYNRGGGKISTISRAVVMLGINPVRSIAAGLMLFEHMQNKLQASQLKEYAVQALFSGLLANSLARTLAVPNHEEAFLCALLQQLGKMLVRFYLNEEARAIDKLILQQECAESTAVIQVLGISYHRLGMSVAREWGFPPLIYKSMQPFDFDDLPEANSPEIKLHLVAQFSSALGACLNLPLPRQAPAIKKLCKQFATVLEIDESKVSDLLENCHRELTQFSRLIQFDLGKSVYYQQISSAGSLEPVDPQDSARDLEFGATDSVKILVDQSGTQSPSVDKILTDGIQDITNTLTGDYNLNQIMQMILETIYRALGGSRVALCLKDRNSATIRARFGYGAGIENVIEHFAIDLSSASNVFQVAFGKNVDIHIENTGDEKIRDRIPAWYHQHIAARSFTIFPIVIRQSPVALIYIDSAGDAAIEIGNDQLGLLKTLRNQAILAIKGLD